MAGDIYNRVSLFPYDQQEILIFQRMLIPSIVRSSPSILPKILVFHIESFRPYFQS